MKESLDLIKQELYCDQITVSLNDAELLICASWYDLDFLVVQRLPLELINDETLIDDFIGVARTEHMKRTVGEE